MTASPQRQSDRPHKQWASVEQFIKERTTVAKHHSKWTSSQTLYAHYRRWAHGKDCEPMALATVEERVQKVCKNKSVVQHGHMLLPVWIEDSKVTDDEKPEKKHGPVVRGKVRVKRDIQFLGEVLTAGSVVEWMAPTRDEQHNLDRLVKDDDDAASWLVVVFNGRRRFMPGDAVERVTD